MKIVRTCLFSLKCYQIVFQSTKLGLGLGLNSQISWTKLYNDLMKFVLKVKFGQMLLFSFQNGYFFFYLSEIIISTSMLPMVWRP